MAVAGIPLVQVELLVEWGDVPTNAFEIATDDTDTTHGVLASSDADTASLVLTEPEYSANFGGPYDDLSALFVTGNCSRGRNNLLTVMEAGAGSYTVRDPTGQFNYANPSSPLYGQIEDRMHPCRWRLSYGGATFYAFWGYTDTITWEPSGRNAVTVITCVDLFYRLGRDKPTIASTGPTTTGAAISLLLDDLGWPSDPTARSIAVGDSIPGFSADGTKTCSDIIGELLNAEQGIFYIRGDGIPVYEDRYASFAKAPAASVVDRMSNVQPQVNFDLVSNRVTVERTDFAGNVLYTTTVVDATSIDPSFIGPTDFPTVSSPYLATNAQADDLAAWILALVIEPTPPARQLVVDGRDVDLVNAVLALELGDKVTVQEAVGGTTGTFEIEQLQVEVSNTGRVTGTYTVTRDPLDTQVLFVAAADTDTGVGTIASGDTDTGAGVLVY